MKRSTGAALLAGFTLIEILIAMTILFATITTGMLAYQNALDGSDRAGQAMQLLAYVTPVQQHIKRQLITEPEKMQGEGTFGPVRFNWTAELDGFKPPPDRFDADSAEFVKEAPRFQLLTIHLTLALQERQRSFDYQELTWLP